MRRLGLILAVLMCGCGSPSSLVIKASSSSASGEPAVGGLEVFGREVSRRTAGALRVEVYPNSALGNEREVLELTIIGAVEIVCPSNAPLATFVPELMVFELPYLFLSRRHFYEVLDGPIGRDFAEPLRRRGLRLLGYFDLGHRHLMTRDRVVRGLADMKGLKIRTMENALHLRAFQAFGASPLPMAYGEVYTALEQGVIDGAEAARTNYHAKRFYEVAPHWAEIGWMYIVSPLVMSERFYQSLPADQRRAVEEAARVAVRWERQEYQRQEEIALDALHAAGVESTHPAREGFLRAAEKVWRESSDRVDARMIEAILKVGKKP
jgi:tripartite ATP-independent transporter DctP family solute receptor